MELRGKEIAEELYSEIQQAASRLKAINSALKIVSIRIGDSAATKLYVRNQQRAANRLGIEFCDVMFSEQSSFDTLNRAIVELNSDDDVTGIVLQRPVPPNLSIRQLQEGIHPLKDIEGMHPSSIGRIVYQDCELAPCTAAAALYLLKKTGLRLPGLEVTIIGSSEIVGKPIAFLLIAEGATVTVCHHLTKDVALHSRKADALFVAVGKPGLLHGDMIKAGAAVIDIGINRKVLDGKSTIMGDADYASCKTVAGWITPVPGGVGPVTVAMLMRNAVTAAERLRMNLVAAK